MVFKKSRYLVLFGFSLGTAVNGISWLSGTVMTAEFAKGYNTTEGYVTLCGSMFMITYVLFGFVATYII